MNYSQVKENALLYADRALDPEVVDRIDSFLRIVEARINRAIRVGDMVVRSQIHTLKDKEYYGLPTDFDGLRSIDLIKKGVVVDTLQYLNPEQLNNANKRGVYYNIVAGQLRIFPAQEDSTLEIVYYQRLPPLGVGTLLENWLSLKYPDAYVFGLVAEISAFAKDKESLVLWDARFKETINEVVHSDTDNRWSGTTLAVRTA